MKTLLQINTSLYSNDGQSSELADRKVLLFAAHGGKYKDTPRDTQTAFISNFLNFIGIRNIEFVHAEGLSMGDEVRQQSMDTAADTIARIAA